MACQSASRKIVVISGWVERGDEKEAFLSGGWERDSWAQEQGEELGQEWWGQGVNALHCTYQGECMLCVAAWVVGRKAG